MGDDLERAVAQGIANEKERESTSAAAGFLIGGALFVALLIVTGAFFWPLAVAIVVTVAVRLAVKQRMSR